MRVVASLLVLLLASGCSGPNPHSDATTMTGAPDGTGDTTTTSLPPLTPPYPVGDIRLANCVNEAMAWGPIPHAPPASWFPAGYSADYIVGPGTADGYLDFFDCGSVVIGQQAVLHGVRLLLVTVPVLVSSDLPQHSNGNNTHVLIIDFLVSNETVASAFASLGFPAQTANFTVETDATGPSAWQVEIDSTPGYSYRAIAPPDVAQAYGSAKAVTRFHGWVGNPDQVTWFDAYETLGQQEGLTSTSTLVAAGGRLSEFTNPDHLLHGSSVTSFTTDYDLVIRPTGEP